MIEEGRDQGEPWNPACPDLYPNTIDGQRTQPENSQRQVPVRLDSHPLTDGPGTARTPPMAPIMSAGYSPDTKLIKYLSGHMLYFYPMSIAIATTTLKFTQFGIADIKADIEY